jgi:hypothetical protein
MGLPILTLDGSKQHNLLQGCAFEYCADKKNSFRAFFTPSPNSVGGNRCTKINFIGSTSSHNRQARIQQFLVEGDDMDEKK